MFFDASAQLVKSLPELGALIEQSDSFIASIGRDVMFTADSLAARLHCDASQLSTVLEQLALAGVLNEETVINCTECETFNNKARERCTSCGVTLETNTATAYTRLSDINQTTTGRDAPTPVDPNARPSATVGVITALEREFAALTDVLGLAQEWFAPGGGAGRRYVWGEVPGAGGTVHHVVATLLATTGNNSAAARAAQLLMHFDGLPHIVMCGIAAGVPDPEDVDGDIRLGDVVISDAKGVIQYDLGKDRNGEFEETYSPRPPSAQLVEAAQHLVTGDLLGSRPWERHVARAERLPWSARPPDNAGAQFGTVLTYRANSRRRENVPHLYRGPIASANQVLRNATKREELRQKFRIRAVEMEGSGVADATWQAEAGYLVVRGIVDFADGEKGDVWHGYGSFAAASVLRALLERMGGSRG